MAQRNNNNARSNRGRHHSNSGANCTCNYRLMYIMARSPTVTGSRSNNTSTFNSPNSSSRRTRSGDQRQHDTTNPIISARHRLCALANARPNPVPGNFTLRITEEADGPHIEIRQLENQIIPNSPNRPHNSGRRHQSRSNADFSIFPFNQDVHLPWPNMNPVHNFRRPNAPRSSIQTIDNSSNNGTRTRSRASRTRFYSANSDSDSSSSNANMAQFRYIPNRSGSVSSIESDQMSRESDYSNNSDVSTNVFPSNGREECLVCLSNLSEYILVNCGHICLCGDCVIHFRRQRYGGDDTPSTRCPLCRAPILSTPRRF